MDNFLCTYVVYSTSKTNAMIALMYDYNLYICISIPTKHTLNNFDSHKTKAYKKLQKH